MNVTFKLGFLSALLVGGSISAAAAGALEKSLVMFSDDNMNHVVTMSIPRGIYTYDRKAADLTPYELEQADDYVKLSKLRERALKDELNKAERAEFIRLDKDYVARRKAAMDQYILFMKRS